MTGAVLPGRAIGTRPPSHAAQPASEAKDFPVSPDGAR
jgi:hypothetical protein